MAPVVLVRADAGPRIGSGHLVRQLALADLLAARGAEVVVVTTGDDPRITAAGHRSLTVPEQADATGRPWPAAAQLADARATIERAGGAVDVVVVDHYGLDHVWEAEVRRIADRVVAVDDLAGRRRDVDLLVDHNWYGAGSAGRYDGTVPDGCELLLGPRYALLHPAYAELRKESSPAAVPPRRLLVSFGGTDPAGETRTVLEALRGRPAFERVEVVVGSPAALAPGLEDLVADVPGAELHVALPSLAPSLQRADLAIGASGTATWERICLQVPAIVTTTAPHQSGVTRALAEAGLTTWAGLVGEVGVDGYRALLDRAAEGALPLPPPLVDGYGAARVAHAVLPTRPTGPDDGLRLRLAGPEDAPVAVARGDDPAGWVAAGNRFASDLVVPDVVVVVVEVDGVPSACLRVTRDGPDVDSTNHIDILDKRAAGIMDDVLDRLVWPCSEGEPTRLAALVPGQGGR